MNKSGEDTEISWLPKPGITYDLIRGSVGAVSLDCATAECDSAGDRIDLGDAVCLDQQNASGISLDSTPAPMPGAGAFYLVRDHVTPGAWGYGSNDLEREPASGDCPLPPARNAWAIVINWTRSPWLASVQARRG